MSSLWYLSRGVHEVLRSLSHKSQVWNERWEKPRGREGGRDHNMVNDASNSVFLCSVSPRPGGRSVPVTYHPRQCAQCRGCQEGPGEAGVFTRASWSTGCPGLALKTGRLHCLCPSSLQVPHQPTTPHPSGGLGAPSSSPGSRSSHLLGDPHPTIVTDPLISSSELVIPPVSFSPDSEDPVLFLHSPHALCLSPPRLACCPTVTGPPHCSP